MLRMEALLGDFQRRMTISLGSLHECMDNLEKSQGSSKGSHGVSRSRGEQSSYESNDSNSEDDFEPTKGDYEGTLGGLVRLINASK